MGAAAKTVVGRTLLWIVLSSFAGVIALRAKGRGQDVNDNQVEGRAKDKRQRDASDNPLPKRHSSYDRIQANFPPLALTGLRVRGAILLGILGSTLVAAGFGLVKYTGVVAWPSGLGATLGQMDFAGLFRLPPGTVATAIFVLLFLAMFDTVGTLVGVGRQAGLLRGGELPRAERALAADAVGTTMGRCWEPPR